jgi:hypothetical protein
MSDFVVFGTRPDNAIYLPDVPFSVRFNCKDGGGGLFIGGSDPQHRRTNPEDKIDINIIKVSKWFGSLGKTQKVLWIQLFFIPAPGVAPEILPKNTVCVGYLKKQSIANLFNTVQTAMNSGEPALGIFTLGFNKESGAAGSYYTVSFNWRERQADEELQQLELIKAFMESYRERLVDLEGTRELVCVDGWSAEQIQALLLEVKQEVYLEEPPALPERKQRRLSGSR